MKNSITAFFFILSLSAIIISCTSGAKEKKGETGDLKVKLEKLKKEKTTLDNQIRETEDKIAKADPNAVKAVQKLVAVDTVRANDFTHFIELQGQISSDGLAYVSPTGSGGLVRAVYVKAGQRVSKGQVLVKLDDAIARQQITSAQQQTGVLKARLAQAQTVYERYQNLWKQGIGAEINVINAKADVDALSSQLRAAQAQVGIAQEQANMSMVRAGISGVVDEVNVRVGEFFSGIGADRKPQIVIVNLSNLKVEVPVPDNYVSRIKKGDKVEVVVPETGRAPYPSTISVVGNSIDPTTRSFTTEAKLPADPILKPNQRATMKILDYESKNAIAVPVNVVQSDEKGKYVFVMEKTADRAVARRRVVITGETYGGMTEIKSGLQPGDVIITEGYQLLYDGQAIITR
jgi:membrane fusion protein (multidrug efflux system)